MVPKLSQWQAVPWDAKQTYITVLNLATCFRERMQFALNKKLEYCSTTMCTVPIEGPSRLKIRLCQDKYWCSCWLNLNVQFQKIFAPNTHSWPVFTNFKVRGGGSPYRKKNLYVGYESFLEENNVWEIIN